MGLLRGIYIEREAEKGLEGGNSALQQCLFSRTFYNDENIMYLHYQHGSHHHI